MGEAKEEKKGTGGSKGGKKGVEEGKGGKRGRRLSEIEDLEFFDLVLEGSFSTTGTEPPMVGKKGKGKGGSKKESQGGKRGRILSFLDSKEGENEEKLIRGHSI